MKKTKPELSIIDLRITDLAHIPANYFLAPEVGEALHKVILKDVVLNDKPCPPGTEPVYGPIKGTSAAQAIKLRVATNAFTQAVKKEWRFFVVVYVTVVLAIVTAFLLSGGR